MYPGKVQETRCFPRQSGTIFPCMGSGRRWLRLHENAPRYKVLVVVKILGLCLIAGGGHSFFFLKKGGTFRLLASLHLDDLT